MSMLLFICYMLTCYGDSIWYTPAVLLPCSEITANYARRHPVLSGYHTIDSYL